MSSSSAALDQTIADVRSDAGLILDTESLEGFGGSTALLIIRRLCAFCDGVDWVIFRSLH